MYEAREAPVGARVAVYLMRRPLLTQADAVTRFAFRAVRPVFDLHPFFACGEPQPDGASHRLWIRDHAGRTAMEATAVAR